MTCKRESELLAEIEQTGAMYKVSTLKLIKAGSRIAELDAQNGEMGQFNAGLVHERDDIQLALSRCNETKTALQMNLREAHKERDALAAQNQALRCALYLTHEHGRCYFGEWYSSGHNVFTAATKALALPDTSAEILRARDARVLRDAAEICDEENNNWAHNGASHAADVLRWKADKLEQKNG